jgi:hypothetical protein
MTVGTYRAAASRRRAGRRFRQAAGQVTSGQDAKRRIRRVAVERIVTIRSRISKLGALDEAGYDRPGRAVQGRTRSSRRARRE